MREGEVGFRASLPGLPFWQGGRWVVQAPDFTGPARGCRVSGAARWRVPRTLNFRNWWHPSGMFSGCGIPTTSCIRSLPQAVHQNTSVGDGDAPWKRTRNTRCSVAQKKQVKNQNKKHSVNASFHLFQHHTISPAGGSWPVRSACVAQLRQRSRHPTPTDNSNPNLSVPIWIVTHNVGRSFCESFHKMFHLPYQDHPQSTFLSYRILNYWEFINCWIYNNLCLYVTENGVRADI